MLDQKPNFDHRLMQLPSDDTPPFNPPIFLNRELSQLNFIHRVLTQGKDRFTPLLERLRFLCISCSNLDEFFEIRVASVNKANQLGLPPSEDGLQPKDVLAAIHQRALHVMTDQFSYWKTDLAPALNQAGIEFLNADNWSQAQRRWLRQFFRREVMPLLSPIRLDSHNPFPKIYNKSINVVVSLNGKDAFGRSSRIAVIRSPRSLQQLIALPDHICQGKSCQFVFMSTLLHAFVKDFFNGTTIEGAYFFRVTRDSEIVVNADDDRNLAVAIHDELQDRGYQTAMRLEMSADCPEEIRAYLLQQFQLAADACYPIDGPLDLGCASQLYTRINRDDLKYPPFVPQSLATTRPLFDLIAQKDLLLHHPFQAFTPVLDFLHQAATDPQVLAIKQTLYRTGAQSAIVDNLILAARNGKEVTVVIELRARFDEEANLSLASRLQDSGVQVAFGAIGHKTHAKMLLVVRKERRQLRRYVHLGSGNYHSVTACLYTDLSLFTADPDICNDVHLLFLHLYGCLSKISLKYILLSPFTLHTGLLNRIERERQIALQGRPAQIIAKLNALNEPQLIRALYRASQAGVSIHLIVRGACTLRPGVPGVSDRIHVRSVIGRFLEHSRVYWFCNNGASELFCGSADWLERNLLWRIETCFPILDPDIARQIYRDVLRNYLDDNLNAWEMDANGQYHKIIPANNTPPHSAQMTLLQRSQQESC